jgi:hypothetical protein
MALENLVRLAERISSLPDEALAQLTQTEGIEPVIAASELKNRQDIRAEAAAQPQQNPSVVNQLIQRAMGQQQQPQGMPQQGMQQQQGMPQQMPPQMAQQGPPQMPPQMPPQGPPMANMGGLLRRFATGDLVPSPFEEDFFETYGVTPEDAAGGPMSPEALEQMRSAYDEEWNKPLPGAYNLALQSAPVTTPEYDVSQGAPGYGGQQGVPGYGGMPPPGPTLRQLQPVEREEIANQAEQQAKRAAATKRIREMKFEGDKQMVPGRMEERYSPTERGKVERTFIEAGDPSGALAPRERDPLIPMDAAIGPSGGGQTQVQVQKDERPSWMSPRKYKNLQDLETASGEGQDTLYRMATTSFMQGQSARNNALRGMGSSADPTSTELTKKLSKLDADDMKRLQGYNDDIDKYLGELDELEKDIPDRKSIKDRFKKQIDYGLAQAFFSAAEKGSPDFMTAMAGSMAGASEVMNKMTGQEQKELYKHATDAFTRKASRANASFKQRTELGKQIASRAATTAKSRTNLLEALKFQADVSDKAIDNARENYNAVITAGKTQSEIRAARRTYFRDYEDQIADNVANMAKDVAGNLVDTKQWQSHFSVDGAMAGVPSAQTSVNLGLKGLFRELAEKTEAAREANIDNPAQNAMNELMAEIEDSDEQRIGDRSLMQHFGADLQGILQTTNARETAEIAQQLRRVYPWIDL